MILGRSWYKSPQTNCKTFIHRFDSDRRLQIFNIAVSYEGRIKGDDGVWSAGVYTGDSQDIIFNGLTPGKTYTVQVRALGGSTGQSDWSDPSSHIVM